jgi:hypothetical protein
MFEAGRMPDACPPAAAPRSAVTGRFVRQQEGSDARKRDRKLTLTKVDKRGRFGKRVAELKAIFIAALGDEAGLSAMKRLRVEKAAQLTAIAELARGDFMRDGTGTLDDIVRCERKAEQAVRSLGISEAKREKRLTVQEYLEARDARMAAEQ